MAKMLTLRVWLAVAVLSLPGAGYAQTMVVEDTEVAANKSNVSPAGEQVVNGFRSRYQKLAGETLELTDAILANLTGLELSNVSLFYFDDDTLVQDYYSSFEPQCKLFPGDLSYPGPLVWNLLDILTGGALIETVPIGAACYSGDHYDEKRCQFLLDNWADSDTHITDPTSIMSPLYQGATCQPQGATDGGACELGGFPSYSVNVSNVYQIQLAVNFARNMNLRLVIRNTGHDFLGKSTGAGALSLWTRGLNSINVIHDYDSPGGSYHGPAFKLGAGVLVHELYEAAEREGYTAVGGECRTVGVTGGYATGGGHSPMTPIAGLASDQILSVNIVTADGRFVTADETQNTDLFWAIRGGGAATWGVVTSMTFKVLPKKPVVGMTWSTSTSALNITTNIFFEALEAYWKRFPEYSDVGSYGYNYIFPDGRGGYSWSSNPWLVTGLTLQKFKDLVTPLLEDWSNLGVNITPEFFEYDSFYPAWINHFPTENVGNPYVRTGSRLLPRQNWEDENVMNKTFSTLRSIVEDGSVLIHYNINGAAPEGVLDSSVNPAWRDALMFAIIGTSWTKNSSATEIAAANKRLTRDFMQRLKSITPGGGGYGNEGDVMDSEFGQSFFGSNYQRLLQIKRDVDPRNVFWAPTAVGSEDWYITGQEDYLTTQTGRLCRR